MGYFQVRYDTRVVIYEQKLFIRLATAESCDLSCPIWGTYEVNNLVDQSVQVKIYFKHFKIRDSSKRIWAVVVAQLVERSLQISKVRSSNPVIGNNLYIEHFFIYCQLWWKDENKEKEARYGPFFLQKRICKKVPIPRRHQQ